MMLRLALRCSVVIAACASAESSSAGAQGELVGGVETAAPSARDSTVLAASTPSSAVADTGARRPQAARADRLPNELGRIPVFEYHLITERNGVYERTQHGLRHDLETMYRRGMRPVSMSELVDKKLDLPAGLSPVVLVFDDASPSQFRYIEKNGRLEIDPSSAVGILLEFNRRHPDWRNRAVFCLLPAAQAGRSFFGDKGIEGQKTEWRFQKVKFLADREFELCNHTLYHARLDKAGDRVAEFIARGDMAIDSAVPGYRVRTFALPLGMWPKPRDLARTGSWRDPKSGRAVTYSYDAILEVAGGPARSPFDPKFDRTSIPRVQVIGDSAVTRTIDQLERSGQLYVSDGIPGNVARPPQAATAAGGGR